MSVRRSKTDTYGIRWVPAWVWITRAAEMMRTGVERGILPIIPFCPITVHAVLHIADSIANAGPVWTAWAFPMERYCGRLQPAIRNRRFPYSSLDRYVLDAARLDQIKLLYGPQTAQELALGPPNLETGTAISGCEY